MRREGGTQIFTAFYICILIRILDLLLILVYGYESWEVG